MSGICALCGTSNEFCGECAPDLERKAAALWRSENPNMSVFACDSEMQNKYRRRVRRDPYATTFTGMFAIELLAVLAIFVIAIIAVRLNAVSLQTLQDYFG